MDASNWVALFTGFPWWPLAALVLLVVFRRELRSFVRNARRVEVGPVSLERELETAEDSERRSSSRRSAGAVGLQEWSADSDATRDPSGTVLKAWSALERALVDVAQKAGLSVTSRSSPREVLDVLHTAGEVDEAYTDAVWNLRLVRNKVAHAPDVHPTPGQAHTYAQTAARLRERLG